ncbi:uncharacterized protein BO95DRAFT_458925 [Aspergillus brunneoviolaceus CBS 621.78]|uniref:Uncharacterized protein n=1 Tax=Aspergillus brunneoviolaceus CBS 621.78 TaxID=1450534 RepID=A0ACD1GMP2_9EURO|nr:hypothetical protein BO95DRAFT_458925 [Aspergillus brunneoviolaceus CBS 621.78]RAH50440.1 hypothetical protein BO95DRAFT_458925 [Aspergillus brunneoviolaceus CBS 621.78]
MEATGAAPPIFGMHEDVPYVIMENNPAQTPRQVRVHTLLLQEANLPRDRWVGFAKRVLQHFWSREPQDHRRRGALVIYEDRVRFFREDCWGIHEAVEFVFDNELEWYSQFPYTHVMRGFYMALEV